MDQEKIKQLENEIRTVKEQVERPDATHFQKDSLVTITTKNYIDYLRLTIECQTPIVDVKKVAEDYTAILDAYIKD